MTEANVWVGNSEFMVVMPNILLVMMVVTELSYMSTWQSGVLT